MAIFWPYPFTSSWQFTIWLLITVYNDTCMRDIKSVIRQKRRGKKAGGVKNILAWIIFRYISLLTLNAALQKIWRPDTRHSIPQNFLMLNALTSSRFSYAECTNDNRNLLHILMNCWQCSPLIVSSLLRGWWIPFEFYAKDKGMISDSPDVNNLFLLHVQCFRGNEYIYTPLWMNMVTIINNLHI